MKIKILKDGPYLVEGCAYARKYQNGDPVMVIFGDGATNAGNFYESLNL